ncbi:MAG: peptide-methionine (R)-S-oxide reductase MsrB [Acidimicrobiales bacterium]
MGTDVTKTDDEWLAQLGKDRFRVLRRGGTEAPGSGEYIRVAPDGTYRCGACGAELFEASSQFDSHCGWPSFTEPTGAEAVELIPDRSLGMLRTEVRCTSCGSHLGHVFDDGPGPTGQRWCINSLSLQLDNTERGEG